MRVCFLIHGITSGGAERTVSYLCNNFVQRENCIVDLVLCTNEKPFYDIDDRVNMFYILDKAKNDNIIARITKSFARMLKFRKYCKENEPDIIVCMMHLTKTIALLKPKKIPIVLSERYNPAVPRDWKYKLVRKWYYNAADGIIFQTERAKLYYMKYILKDVNKGVVIQNAIGNPYVYNIDALAQPKENKISAIGRLDYQKNYKLLINAFEIVYNKYPEYNLVIFGEGPQKEELKKIVENKKLDKNIHFMGAQKNAIVNIANSKCYVLSSNNEGMPNSLMEAMAVGLPCVSTDCPNGPSELIINGKNGLLVPMNDKESLSAAILKFIENQDFAVQCACNAKRILETNNINVISNKFYKYIIETAKRKK